MSGIQSVQQSRRVLLTSILWIILAIFLFDVQGAFIKHMGARYPIEQIAVFRNFFGIFPSLLVLLLTPQWRSAGCKIGLVRWKLALLRGLILICAQMSFYYSLTKMELATATTLAFAGPLFVTLLSIPLLGHKVGWWRASAVLMGFVGVVLVMGPGSDAFTLVAILPISAAFFYALASLSSRFFEQDEPTSLIGIYSALSAMTTALVLVLITGRWVAFASAQDWLWFIGMGTAGGFAVLLMITAYRMTEPSILSPFEYFGIPFSFFLGWVFFNEMPFDTLFPGVLLIVGGGLLVLWRENRAAKS